MDETSYTKTQILCEHIGSVYAGLGPDFRLLSQKSRKLVQNYFVKYYEPMGVATLCRETSELVQ
jgi:20S proteasome subunit alpha 2